MDQIIISDLKVQGIIGVYDWERKAPQEILINLVLSTDITGVSANDDITIGVDYARVAQDVKKHAEHTTRYTVEALAEDIAALCLQFEGVEWVQVRVEKPKAIEFTRAVGVQIERTK